MKKTNVNARFVKDSIRKYGRTWADMAKHYDCTEKTIREHVAQTYVTGRKAPKYKELNSLSRANEKLQKEVAPVLDPLAEEVHEVIVTETGYLMKFGLTDVLNKGLDIVIPRFCMAELDKLSRSSTAASEVLELIWSTNRITQLKLKDEVLFEEPRYDVKKRSIGIVALCCELFATDMKVHLLTTSYEVAELAKSQGFGSDVKVELVQST